MTDDRGLSTTTTPSPRTGGSEVDKDAQRHKGLEKVPGASPPSDDAAEGEGEAPADKR